jgi:hypothetical protein
MKLFIICEQSAAAKIRWYMEGRILFSVQAAGCPYSSVVRYLDTQARPSPMGLHTPLQHSSSPLPAEPSALHFMAEQRVMEHSWP